MKIEKNEVQPEGFKPFQVVLTIETQEEFRALETMLYCAHQRTLGGSDAEKMAWDIAVAAGVETGDW